MIHEQILKMPVPGAPLNEECRQVKQLHVYADEDQAHMQRLGKEKGKKSQIVSLVTVTEGTARESKGRKRTDLYRRCWSEPLTGKETEDALDRIYSCAA